jgi:hypothetical protein
LLLGKAVAIGYLNGSFVHIDDASFSVRFDRNALQEMVPYEKVRRDARGELLRRDDDAEEWSSQRMSSIYLLTYKIIRRESSPSINPLKSQSVYIHRAMLLLPALRIQASMTFSCKCPSPFMLHHTALEARTPYDCYHRFHHFPIASRRRRRLQKQQQQQISQQYRQSLAGERSAVTASPKRRHKLAHQPSARTHPP